MAWADLADQRPVVQLLQRSLERGRLGHAYLFVGDRMDTLQAAAQTLAKTVDCDQPETAANASPLDCCDRCPSCLKIQAANHPDVQWIKPESKSRIITIDQIRQLMQFVHLKPSEASYKVGVVVAADRLNIHAANAFLKTLEEPPAKSILILLSTHAQRILETIASRCLRLNFGGEGAAPINPEIRNWVKTFGQLAAKESKGWLGRYRLLGALLLRLGQVKREIEASLGARSALERFDDVDPGLREKWEEELIAAIESEYRHQRANLLFAVQLWFRDLWIQTLAFQNRELSYPELVDESRVLAKRISNAEAAWNLQIIEDIQRLLGSNVQEVLALEVGLLKLKF